LRKSLSLPLQYPQKTSFGEKSLLATAPTLKTNVYIRKNTWKNRIFCMLHFFNHQQDEMPKSGKKFVAEKVFFNSTWRQLRKITLAINDR
jgi:hypothetical protein